MARASSLNVRALLSDQNIDIDDVDLGSAITTANLYVDEQLADYGLSDEILTEIEKYLAAHFVVIRALPAGVTEQTIDEDREKFSTEQGLKSTQFGQVAATLDVTGTLGKAGRPASTLKVL